MSLKVGSNSTKSSRRNLFKGGVTAAAAMLAAQVNRDPAQQTGTMAGRKFRAFVRNGTSASVLDLKLLPIQPRGVVEAIGPQVKRVQPGDRVIVGVTPQCGECYNCLHGRADRCLMHPEPGLPVAEMQDGTPVISYNHKGGFGDLMVTLEEYCCAAFSDAPAVDLSMLHCVGLCGLGAAMTVAPVEAGSDVVVLGCGPVGLCAVQGARIKGASQIIAVEPIRYRRDVALKVGATVAVDPNAERDQLVQKIQQLCKAGRGPKLAGGGNLGPDYVIEAVGGDTFPPKVEVGPDPTGVLPLQQAWQLCSGAGHVVTTSVGHPTGSTISFPANQWSNGAKNHHPGNLAGANPKRDLPRFIRFIETGQFNAKALATATYRLEQTRDAFQAVADRTTIAAVVVFS